MMKIMKITGIIIRKIIKKRNLLVKKTKKAGSNINFYIFNLNYIA